jgi:RimJ/RimL family protein N-acetyltransferase
MSAEVTLWQSRSISDFHPLFADLTPALGARFPESMKNWCGIGERPYPLAFWQVYLANVGEDTVGVTGLYRQNETAPEVCWVGWFGVLPQHRGKAIGATILTLLMQRAKEFGFAELRAYTDENNPAAIAAYEAAGFAKAGVQHSSDRGRSADPDGLVMVAKLE